MSDIESGVQFTRPDPYQEAFIDLEEVLTLTHRLNLNLLNFPINFEDRLNKKIDSGFNHKLHGHISDFNSFYI